MSRATIQSEMNEGDFDISGSTPVRLINVGTPRTPTFLLSYGTTMPSAGSAGYVKGGLFIATTGGTVYRNAGSGSSSGFTGV